MTEPRKRGRPATGQTPQHNLRISHERWQRFEDAAEKAGTTRADAANRLIAWYAREPGAKLPNRPPVEDAAE